MDKKLLPYKCYLFNRHSTSYYCSVMWGQFISVLAQESSLANCTSPALRKTEEPLESISLTYFYPVFLRKMVSKSDFHINQKFNKCWVLGNVLLGK